jgi:hypothetical protein
MDNILEWTLVDGLGYNRKGKAAEKNEEWLMLVCAGEVDVEKQRERGREG